MAVLLMYVSVCTLSVLSSMLLKSIQVSPLTLGRAELVQELSISPACRHPCVALLVWTTLAGCLCRHRFWARLADEQRLAFSPLHFREMNLLQAPEKLCCLSVVLFR